MENRVMNAETEVVTSFTTEQLELMLQCIKRQKRIYEEGLEESLRESENPKCGARQGHKDKLPIHRSRVAMVTDMYDKLVELI